MTKFTPGPWRVEQWSYDNGKRVVPTIQNDRDAVAQINDLWCMDDRAAEAAANARLIAAAPAMAELLQRIADTPCDHGPQEFCPREQALALLARIES